MLALIDMELLVGSLQLDPARMKGRSLCNAGEESKALRRLSRKAGKPCQSTVQDDLETAGHHGWFHTKACHKILAAWGEDLDFLPFYVSGCPNIRRLPERTGTVDAVAAPEMPNQKAFAQYLRSSACRMCKCAQLSLPVGGVGPEMASS
jgi:hypothetical protein